MKIFVAALCASLHGWPSFKRPVRSLTDASTHGALVVRDREFTARGPALTREELLVLMLGDAGGAPDGDVPTPRRARRPRQGR